MDYNYPIQATYDSCFTKPCSTAAKVAESRKDYFFTGSSTVQHTATFYISNVELVPTAFTATINNAYRITLQSAIAVFALVFAVSIWFWNNVDI